MSVSFARTHAENKLLDKIIARVGTVTTTPIDRKSLEMDLVACHANGCPLDFEKLLGFSDDDFTHDVFGIRSHIDRKTGKLRDLFSPRCAKPEPTRFEIMFAKLKADAKTVGDAELIALFERHLDAVSKHYESSVPALDGSDYWKFKPTKDYPLNQFHGPLFHKGFRQFDVTSSGSADTRIWRLLSNSNTVDGAPAFWPAHAESMK